jgi:1-acyl-sn-glycerol-3-phosphate acyltransferase
MSSVETLPAPRLTVGATRLWRTGRRLVRMSRIVLHLLLGLLVAQLLLLDPRALGMHLRVRKLQRDLIRRWARALCRILNLRVRQHGPLPTRTSLLVTNHVSWLDIPALLSLVEADFVAKSDVLRWPLIGTLAARAGTVFLARGQRNAARTTADGMTSRLAQRRHVLFFPEATTGDGRGVRKFYARLYQAAIRTHSHVQACAIRYPGLDGAHGPAPFIDNDELVPHMWRLLGEKEISVELHFCEPMLPLGDRRSLANRTRAQICAALGVDANEHQALTGKMRFPRAQPLRRAA